jgi:hypothetical protein
MLAYKTLEADETFDIRLADFFVQGVFHHYKPATTIKRKKASQKKRPAGKVKQAMYKLGKLLAEEKRNKARVDTAPGVPQKTWILLEKLSKIAPFN